MSLESLSDESIREYQNALLEKIPTDGTLVGNVSLLKQLRWPEDRFWSIRDRLIDQGILEKGRGRGGSIRRVMPLPEGVVEEDATAPSVTIASAVVVTSPICIEKYTSESDLYEPMAAVLRNRWARDRSYDRWRVEVTALQGRRDTGGRWTRPDITIASLSTYLYLPQKSFDVTTIEVKKYDRLDVTAIYEALAHLRSATRAYVLAYVPDTVMESMEEILSQVYDEARRHGVGVIIAGNPESYEDWEEAVEAVRHEPDPDRLNEFIRTQLSQEFKDEIVRWFR